ncbi:SDR family oxidoreductase [Auraticoccus sp. F435]|uniref:SDR family oxidoreductase n=1 Tax=Auraticoccus cholistanensis TaxID=2656650 RepID=A0A6A9UZX8_9ACTN|nr:SDR family oxidoreductase [Auraticoccus cholistanensis]
MGRSPFDLTGRTALVTGASRGIGLAVAEGLAAAGADVVAVSATLGPGSEVERRVTALGRRCEVAQVDFTDRDAVLELGERMAERRPGVDILVNNAGTIRRAPAAEHPLADWDEVLQVDLSSQFALTQQLARPMLERGSGKVIFTASLLSFQGGITVPGYAAAKHGIAGLTRALANEWAGRGVNVNAIVPGYIATDNNTALREDPVRSAELLARIPAGRWGDPADLAGAAVFLASSASDYVHGTLLAVDGGWLAR